MKTFQRISRTSIPDDEITRFVEEFKIGRKSRWTALGDTLLKYIPANQLGTTLVTEEEE